MTRRLQVEIEALNRELQALGSMVEERVRMAVRAIHQRDAEIANSVLMGDPEIDEMEVDLEEECLKVLALHQPVAMDLRYIIAILKINSDLERIGDLAVNIAERALALASLKPFMLPFDFHAMMATTQRMLQQSLDSLVNLDAEKAMGVCRMDEEVDRVNREMHEIAQRSIEENVKGVPHLLNLLSVSRHLERIADHATNIAEDVIYLVQGDIARHHRVPFPHGKRA